MDDYVSVPSNGEELGGLLAKHVFAAELDASVLQDEHALFDNGATAFEVEEEEEDEDEEEPLGEEGDVLEVLAVASHRFDEGEQKKGLGVV